MSDYESAVATAAVGIDLGTTNSVVAVYKDGEVHVLVDEEGHNFTPSVVAFTDTAQLVGWRALKQYAENPDNTVSEVKRLMGRKFNELQVLEDMQRWPFTVVNKEGEPRLEVEYRSEKRLYRPEQVSAILLLKLKQMACDFLEVPPFSQLDAVITVPVYFNDSQRLATKEAGEIAGLNITRIITEPAAAAVAYGMQNKDCAESASLIPSQRVLVFDMGGGTTDVSLLRLEQSSQYTVLACRGDNHLGGEDIDTLIVEQCLDRLYEDHKIRLKNNLCAMTRLRAAAQKAKCTLSSGTRAHIELDALVGNLGFEYDISRKTFEALCESLLQRSLKLVEGCLEEAGVAKKDVDKVVLAGGSTRIPYVKTLLGGLLPGVELHCSINQEEAVAYGAAVQAAKDKNVLRETFLLSEVIPWSLGINVVGEFTVKVLKKNSPIPVTSTKVFQTATDMQDAMLFKIYEGEDKKSEKNKFLGSMTLANIKVAKRGDVAADTTFEVDAHGILQVTAKEQGTENEISVKIERYKKHLTFSQVEGLNKKVQEENLHGLVCTLSDQLYQLEITVYKEDELSEEQRNVVSAEVAKMRKWERDNPQPSADRYNNKLNELRQNLAFCAKISNNGSIKYQLPE